MILTPHPQAKDYKINETLSFTERTLIYLVLFIKHLLCVIAELGKDNTAQQWTHITVSVELTL